MQLQTATSVLQQNNTYSALCSTFVLSVAGNLICCLPALASQTCLAAHPHKVLLQS